MGPGQPVSHQLGLETDILFERGDLTLWLSTLVLDLMVYLFVMTLLFLLKVSSEGRIKRHPFKK